MFPPSSSYAFSDILTPNTHMDNSFHWIRLESEEIQSEVYQKLCDNVHSLSELSKNNFRTEPYMRIADLEKHRKCTRCFLRKREMKGKKYCTWHLDPEFSQNSKGEKHHNCCGRSDACQFATWHKWEEATPEFEDRYGSFIESPGHDTASIRRKAVVIDCEMVGVSNGFGELARLCIVDYLTGETLTNCFVDPGEKVLNYRTCFSGVTADRIVVAKNNSNCLPNWSAARDALLKFVDARTIIIGSGLRNDLDVLRLVHTNVVDSSLMTWQKVGKRLGIKHLSKELLNLDIQSADDGHDPLEDCLATREVVLWMTYAGRNKFDEWLVIAKEKVEAEREKQHQHEIEQRQKREHDSE